MLSDEASQRPSSRLRISHACYIETHIFKQYNQINMHFVIALLGQNASVVVNWVAIVPCLLKQNEFCMI